LEDLWELIVLEYPQLNNAALAQSYPAVCWFMNEEQLSLNLGYSIACGCGLLAAGSVRWRISDEE
jgi:hypothetical protein